MSPRAISPFEITARFRYPVPTMHNTPAPQPVPKPAPKRTSPEPGAGPSRRGGKRPGAGAPKGNLNALKHGRRSRQFHQIGAVFAANPTLHAALIDLGQRHLDKQLSAEEVATALFTRLFEHAKAVARGEPSRGPFANMIADTPEIKRLKDAQSSLKRPGRSRSRTKTPRKSKNAAAQSTTQPESPTHSDPRYKNRAQWP